MPSRPGSGGGNLSHCSNTAVDWASCRALVLGGLGEAARRGRGQGVWSASAGRPGSHQGRGLKVSSGLHDGCDDSQAGFGSRQGGRGEVLAGGVDGCA